MAYRFKKLSKMSRNFDFQAFDLKEKYSNIREELLKIDKVNEKSLQKFSSLEKPNHIIQNRKRKERSLRVDRNLKSIEKLIPSYLFEKLKKC